MAEFDIVIAHAARFGRTGMAEQIETAIRRIVADIDGVARIYRSVPAEVSDLPRRLGHVLYFLRYDTWPPTALAQDIARVTELLRSDLVRSEDAALDIALTLG